MTGKPYHRDSIASDAMNSAEDKILGSGFSQEQWELHGKSGSCSGLAAAITHTVEYRGATPRVPNPCRCLKNCTDTEVALIIISANVSFVIVGSLA